MTKERNQRSEDQRLRMKRATRRGMDLVKELERKWGSSTGSERELGMMIQLMKVKKVMRSLFEKE